MAPSERVQDYVDAWAQKAAANASDISRCLYAVLVANPRFDPATPGTLATQTLYAAPQQLAWAVDAWSMAGALAM